MDIQLDKITKTEALIKIKVSETDYQPKVEEKIREYSRKASIKGFRPGKVPQGMIRKMYGKSILVDEVNHMLSHKVSDYIKDNKLEIIGEPLPNVEKAQDIDWDVQKDFEFEYNVGLVDEFSIDLSKKVSVTSYSIKVDKKLIAETVENLKSQFGETSDQETAAEGDNLFGVLKGEDDAKEESIVLYADKLSPKEAKKLVGVTKGAVVEVDIKKLFKEESDLAIALGITKDEAKKLKGKYTFEVKNISRVAKAEVNQELFDKTFGKDAVKSNEEFEQKIKETISENYQQETDMFLDRSIRNEMIKNTKLELPDSFLKSWLLRTNEGQLTPEDIEKEFDAYTKELKWSLIRNKISKDQDLKIEHEDVMEEARKLIRRQLAGSGMGSQFESSIDMFVNNYLQGENGDNYMKVHNQVQTLKVMEYIKSQVTIKSKEVSLDDFRDLPMN
ncbi:MAG: trigger factor [Imperialibacter sp.]|uniref:trigger factor n=1 Tax=Imperialibacter sp. TaxID=2038411 RepID=UPI0032EB195B